MALIQEKEIHREDMEDWAWAGNRGNELISQQNLEKVEKELSEFKHLFYLGKKEKNDVKSN